MLGTANCADCMACAGLSGTGTASCELLGLLGMVKDVFVVICRELARGTVGFSLSNQERCSSRLFEVIWPRCRTHGVCFHSYVFYYYRLWICCLRSRQPMCRWRSSQSGSRLARLFWRRSLSRRVLVTWAGDGLGAKIAHLKHRAQNTSLSTCKQMKFNIIDSIKFLDFTVLSLISQVA